MKGICDKGRISPDCAKQSDLNISFLLMLNFFSRDINHILVVPQLKPLPHGNSDEGDIKCLREV